MKNINLFQILLIFTCFFCFNTEAIDSSQISRKIKRIKQNDKGSVEGSIAGTCQSCTFRTSKFNQPPNDHKIKDKEGYQPIIGILTQPVSAKKYQLYNTTIKNYILEANEGYMRWGGSRTVAIPYDISDKELATLLPQINGVLLTGGSLELFNKTSNQPHKYYQTAKKIYQYSKEKKDKDQEDWPILGTCQGFQILSILAAGDKFELLEVYKMFEDNRPVDWNLPKEKSRLFSKLPDSLAEDMATVPLTFHVHQFSITMEAYNNNPSFNQMFEVLQTDTFKNSTMSVVTVDAIEAKDYAMFGTIYHPEYQIMDFITKKWPTKDTVQTEEIAYSLSKVVHDYALKNSNRPKGNDAVLFNEYATNIKLPLKYPLSLDDHWVWSYAY